ncbi:MAG TPA: hypothetical protein VG294_07385 [Solirubrobacteraceae bacterium]|nr:hypothetical protein [Solirubrobacteraceae bacterium]
MPRRRLPARAACIAVTLACSGLAAAHASAATLAVGQACVVNPNPSVGSPMTVTGAGFTPGGPVSIASNHGGAFSTATADAAGGFAITMGGPILATINPAAAAFVLTATDETSGGTATTSFAAANLAVRTNPAQGKPNKRVTWSFSGFIGGADIYAHYLHGKKVTATVKFGRAQGPCGVLKKRAVFYPGKAKYDLYKVQFDDSRKYLATALPRLVATLRTHIHL